MSQVVCFIFSVTCGFTVQRCVQGCSTIPAFVAPSHFIQVSHRSITSHHFYPDTLQRVCSFALQYFLHNIRYPACYKQLFYRNVFFGQFAAFESMEFVVNWLQRLQSILFFISGFATCLTVIPIRTRLDSQFQLTIESSHV